MMKMRNLRMIIINYIGTTLKCDGSKGDSTNCGISIKSVIC
jgi:hypothetical protein